MQHFSNLSKVSLTIMVGLRFKPSGPRTCALNHGGMLPLWLQIPSTFFFGITALVGKKITQNCVIYYRFKYIFQPHQVYLITNMFYVFLLLSDELTSAFKHFPKVYPELLISNIWLFSFVIGERNKENELLGFSIDSWWISSFVSIYDV